MAIDRPCEIGWTAYGRQSASTFSKPGAEDKIRVEEHCGYPL
jgi:hypothetical protein